MYFFSCIIFFKIFFSCTPFLPNSITFLLMLHFLALHLRTFAFNLLSLACHDMRNVQPIQHANLLSTTILSKKQRPTVQLRYVWLEGCAVACCNYRGTKAFGNIFFIYFLFFIYLRRSIAFSCFLQFFNADISVAARSAATYTHLQKYASSNSKWKYLLTTTARMWQIIQRVRVCGWHMA